MAAVAVERTGVFLHRSAVEAAEAQYLATGKTVKLTIGSKGGSSVTGDSQDSGRLQALEAANKSLGSENKALKKTVDELIARISKLETRVTGLEKPGSAAKSQAPAVKAAAADEDDDDIDLFGSDDDDDGGSADALREKRLAEYAAKKSKKPGPIAKSSVVLDVKPWDDETDMKALENAVRSIQMDGLVWGASKLAPVAFNIKKLSIVCVVEDEKVSIEELQEKIEQFEDFVQSVDIAGFNKI